ncbi:MAG TPA: 3'-5' exonuclease [Gemmatimonadaceae bacterium]|jgi:DNA polymerase-3 subunit epsilon|nr:3'-5' exonuclease [Gemmatimonadaceae bacterium]
MTSVTLGNSDTLLTSRAADFLAAGPADAQSLISYVCQLPGAPATVAEHMATALFAGHARFARDRVGRWMLREASAVADVDVNRTLDQESFVVVDCETTGSRSMAGDRITEVAVVRVHDGRAEMIFETLVNPDRPIPPAVMALTNITWEMVRRAPRFAEICDQLLGALEGSVFVAHNAGFDWRFLSNEITRATRRPLVGQRLCTVRMARHFLPQLRRRNLDSLSDYYGIVNTARHRAGGDAMATAKVFLRFLREARSRDCDTLDDLERLLRQPSRKKKRRRRPPAMPHGVSDDRTA